MLKRDWEVLNNCMTLDPNGKLIVIFDPRPLMALQKNNLGNEESDVDSLCSSQGGCKTEQGAHSGSEDCGERFTESSGHDSAGKFDARHNLNTYKQSSMRTSNRLDKSHQSNAKEDLESTF